jgi:hypothetical protein
MTDKEFMEMAWEFVSRNWWTWPPLILFVILELTFFAVIGYHGLSRF